MKDNIDNLLYKLTVLVWTIDIILLLLIGVRFNPYYFFLVLGNWIIFLLILTGLLTIIGIISYAIGQLMDLIDRKIPIKIKTI